MPSPASAADFLELVRKSGVVDEKRLDAHLDKLRATGRLPAEPAKLAGVLVLDGILTHFQAEQIMLGKWRRFTIGKYKVLERLGSGGMGQVFLCEHKLMRRRVAVKVLPTAKANDPSALERFYREARAVAALDHPNIVHAYDIDQDENLHFLVMEYVDGSNLQEIIKKTGPMDPVRAAHYMAQSANGLHHAHLAGLVHRDIKPGNILVDRTGTVKILDMGLARFFNDEEDILTKKYDENVLGTADYLAPEQALDSHGVDHRADIYSLGATFYFILTGRPPFGEGTVAQKLIWHQTRQPKPVRTLRPEVPEGLVAVLDRMMAKDPAQRYQTPQEVAEALAPWTQNPIAPPREEEMPRLSLAATGVAPGEATQAGMAVTTPPSPAPRKNWQVPPSGNRPASRPAETRAPAAAATQTVPATRTVPPTPTPRSAPTAQSNGQTDPAPAPAPPEPAADEDSIPWEKLASLTKEMNARSDTLPRSSRKKLGSSRKTQPAQAAPTTDRRRVLWLAVAVAVAVIAIILLLLWKFGGTTPGTGERPALRVGPDGEFRRIQDAINKANSGDRIIVAPGRYPEQLDLSQKSGITIECEEGVELVPSPDKGNWVPLLKLFQARDIHVEGKMTLNGEGKLRALVFLQGNSPGVVLKDLRFRGYKETALKVTNCAGTADKPVLLQRLITKSAGNSPPLPAIILIAHPIKNQPAKIDHLHIRDCVFEGDYDPTKNPPIVFNDNQLTPDVTFTNNEPNVRR